MAKHTFLITGASSGIGLHLVHAALRAGHRVLAASRNPCVAATEHPAVEQLGGQWLKIDITSKDTESVVQNVVREHNVDILVNNAGYAILGSLEEMRYVYVCAILLSDID
jgi:NAD(P)-dependent dehydrogenase (short-subunit alcohol dehydrogenase family)